MPPKKPVADSAGAPVKEKTKTKPAVSKPAARPSTAVMVKEALQALDSRKGVSSQAIQSYIKQKYPSVDPVKLKYLVRKTLTKGLENGSLVRPANSTVTTGAVGKFRLAPKVKRSKPKNENMDPNTQKVAEDGKPQRAGATKKKEAATGQRKSPEDSKPPKKSKTDERAATSKVPPAKKPKAKKVEEKGSEETSPSAKPKGAKKETSKTKAAKADSDATGRRGKKHRE